MAPHSSTLAWKIPWTEEPGCVHGAAEGRTRLSDSTFTFHFHALEKEMATHSSILAWRIPGTGEPGGLPSMGSHRVGHYWSNLAAAAAANWRLETKSTAELAGRIQPSANGMLSTTHRSVQLGGEATSTPPPPHPSHLLHPLHLPPASCPWSPAPRPVQPSPGPIPGSAPSQCQLPELWAKPNAWEMQVHMYLAPEKWKKKKKFSLAIHVKKYVTQKIWKVYTQQ